jgi:hypothetical protein
MALKSVIFAAAINPYACFYIFLIWLILIYPRPLESIPQNWFLVSINSIVELYWFGRGREGPWPKSILRRCCVRREIWTLRPYLINFDALVVLAMS